MKCTFLGVTVLLTGDRSDKVYGQYSKTGMIGKLHWNCFINGAVISLYCQGLL